MASSDRSIWASARVAATRKNIVTPTSMGKEMATLVDTATGVASPSLSSSTSSSYSRTSSASHSDVAPVQPRSKISSSSASAWATPPQSSMSGTSVRSSSSSRDQSPASMPSSSSSRSKGSQASMYATASDDSNACKAVAAASSSSTGPPPRRGAIAATAPRQRDTSRHLGGQLDPMSLIASPSRGIQSANSASLGASTEQDLTNHDTQQKYRQYISRRITDHCKRFATCTLDDLVPKMAAAPGVQTQVLDAKRNEEIRLAMVSLDEILLLVRKLREGVMASHRMDAATIEVYQLSLFLSVFTLNSAQLSSTINRLVFDLYPNIPCELATASTGSSWLGSVEEDFANGASQGQADLLLDQLRIFSVDTPSTRAHHASLLLLSHTCLGGATKTGEATSGGLQDNFHTLKHKVLLSLGQTLEQGSSSSSSAHVAFAQLADRAVRSADVFLFRRLVSIEGVRGIGPPSAWQRLLLQQAANKMRTQAWGQIKKAYLSVPLSADLFVPDGETSCEDKADGWLEEVLLLDTAVLPFHSTAAEVDVPSTTAGPTRMQVPDSWDEEALDRLSLTSKASPTSEAKQATVEERSRRLAALFHSQALSVSPTCSEPLLDTSAPPHLRPWIGRIASSRSSGQREEGGRSYAIKVR